MSNARNLARVLPNTSGQISDLNIADSAITNNKLASSAVTSQKISPSNVYLQMVTATTAGYSVTNNGTWLDLGSSSLTITPSKTGNKIIVMAQYVYPKETSNFMNVNAYRLVYGSNIAQQCSESFCYSDPYTHQYMTGQGFAQHMFVVSSSEVGIAQKVSIQWYSGSGAFGVGSYLGSDPAVRLTAWEIS